jgi:hypothetical protein
VTPEPNRTRTKQRMTFPRNVHTGALISSPISGFPAFGRNNSPPISRRESFTSCLHS